MCVSRYYACFLTFTHSDLNTRFISFVTVIMSVTSCSFAFSSPSLLNLCTLKNQELLLKLTVSTLDYSRDGLARVILSKILTAATDVRFKHSCLTALCNLTREALTVCVVYKSIMIRVSW